MVVNLKMECVQALAKSPTLNSIPTKYAYFKNRKESAALDYENPIPIVDFSLLTSPDPNLRSKGIQELDKACQEWGCFQLINHGVPETLMKTVIEKSNEFFNLTNQEKKEYEEKGVLDPIRYGTSVNSKTDQVLYWRDFLKIIAHPKFHCPNKPLGLSEILLEYSQKTREIARGLLGGISSSLGLDQIYLENSLQLESGLQICIVNFYPPCPQPELAIGLPPHTDHGLFTLVVNNGVSGLQLKHKGEWINVNNTLPNSILVNTADQLEIFSNGKYKSVEHRAVVNNEVSRTSIAVLNGPSLETEVKPASKLVDEERCRAAYVPMVYKEYLEIQQSKYVDGKPFLDSLRL
uniref:2-oxoglutarate-dependent dioxygenase 19-like n=1 Tax=Erigeron canadensis TaxID=72917 RepID=UPI001CB90E9F|nr:2-oxoglutarate-dependent dioxygenase 19-like [Erigeron canadensis]